MQAKIKELLKEAMKSGDEIAKSVYRGLLTLIMNELVASGKTPQDIPNDELVMNAIKKAVKQRNDAIEQYEKAERSDLADPEKKEREILMQFLPTQLNKEQLKIEIEKILKELGELDPKNLGKYIGACNAKLKDVANGKDIKEIVESLVIKSS